jgi:DNA-binding NarL/FixJ family response regulator
MNPAPGSPHITRIVLVEDHPVVRDGLSEAINREPDLEVCGVAEARDEALRVVETTEPGLVIVDLLLKRSSGLELIKDLHARWPRLLILVVSMQDENLYAERVLRAGARGYITKQEATRTILAAIRKVLDGGVYLSDTMASSVLARLIARPQAACESLTDGLSDREMQVFELTGFGLSTREIAQRLHLDLKTVESYRARLKDKLKLSSGSELLQLAIRWNQDRRENR